MVSVDYESVFRAGPSPMAVLSPDLVILAVNEAYERVSGRTDAELAGRSILEAFPDNPEDPQGARALRASLERVLATRQRHVMALQRYDVAVPDQPGMIEQRYWSPVNSPVLDESGAVRLILHRVEEVTDVLREVREGGDAAGDAAGARAEVYARSLELQEANQRLAAAADVTTRLLADAPAEEVLELIAARAREIAGADQVVVLVPSAEREQLVVATASGARAEAFRQLRLPMSGPEPQPLSVRVYHRGQSLITEDASEVARAAGLPADLEVGAAALVPLGQGEQVRGVLAAINRPGSEVLTSAVVRALEPFAAQAALALELAERRHDAARLLVLEDRERIAKTLHESVVGRLFQMGMDLTAMLKIVQNEMVARRVRQIVTDMDEAARQLQAAVFGMRARAEGERSVRERIQDLIGTAADTMDLTTVSQLDSGLDAVLEPEAADHLLAVLREALSNVARHSGATQVTVMVDVEREPRRLVATVEDDGDGTPADARGGGLDTMIERARALGGSLEIGGAPRGGTLVTWQIPLPGPDN
ncbi:PAS domain-containing protein [Amycolatopsis sp. K13G38]|uniref:PAS domain-containing protein n=1 Tax=Amycolatopsis acididurans TaxID=2724524 RepID=A0ABX1IZD6_9PSEU|nr:PAS domain-containing protein [Amycolatopsis acididurans]NKQ52888.1 PAS domain-containing protein [Amycolatopsis acididurans]